MLGQPRGTRNQEARSGASGSRAERAVRALTAGLVCAAPLAAQSGLIFATDPVNSPIGSFASALTTLPDRDGDGLDELVVGVPLRLPGGTVLVISSATGEVLDERDAQLGSDRYAIAVERVDDVDGDDVDDLLVGASEENTFNDRPGYVELLSGVDLALITTLEGVAPAGEFGAALASLGDLDGDGSGDFAVGAPGESSPFFASGAVRIYSGNGGAPTLMFPILGGDTAEQRLGSALGNAGDVDGDGVVDLIGGTGALGPASAPDLARVWSGATGAVILDLPEDEPGQHYGSAVDGVGDVNRDGHDDLIVGAWGDGPLDTGLARLHSGADGSVLGEWFGTDTNDHLGEFVAGPGDVDGDGWPDVAFAVPLPGPDSDLPGIVHVHSGRDLSPIRTYSGGAGFDLFGTAVAGAGDLDGDGGDELLIGAPTQIGFSTRGSAGAFSQRPISRVPLLELVGIDPFEELGQSVAAGGDLSGDGVPDLVLGGEGMTGIGTHQGVVRAFSGVDGAPLWTVTGPALIAAETLGRQLAMIGDVNDDGRADVASRILDEVHPVRVLSGADGSLLVEIPGDGLSGYGSGLEAIGDHDGDGVPDVLVGTGPFSSQGTARVHSGVDGSVLVTFTGPLLVGNSAFGERGMTSLGDVNADGVPDYAVGDPHFEDVGAPPGSGSVLIFSGADGSVLRIIPGIRDVDRFGHACVAVPDQDGDGRLDLAVLARGQQNFGGVRPELRLHSSRTGVLLANFTLPGTHGGEGAELVSLGDLDGDGGADVACLIENVSGGAFFNRRIDVVSLDGERRRHVIGGPTSGTPGLTQPTPGFGSEFASAGDLNGDGLVELLVGSPFAGSSRQGGGYLMSTRPITWRGVGAGLELAGVWGTPALRAEGDLLGGDTLTVSVGGGPTGSVAWLVLGLSTQDAPFKGGTLVPTIDLLKPFGLDVRGQLELVVPWPRDVPAELELFLQFWIADAAAPVGFSATNALTATTP